MVCRIAALEVVAGASAALALVLKSVGALGLGRRAAFVCGKDEVVALLAGSRILAEGVWYLRTHREPYRVAWIPFIVRIVVVGAVLPAVATLWAMVCRIAALEVVAGASAALALVLKSVGALGLGRRA